MARVTAEGLQVGAEARGPGAGALGLAGQRGDVARMLGGGLGQRRRIGLSHTASHRGIQAGGVALRPEVPGGRDKEQDCCRETDRHDVPTEQCKDGGASHGYALRSSSKCGPSRKEAQSPPQTICTPSCFAAAFIAALICS